VPGSSGLHILTPACPNSDWELWTIYLLTPSCPKIKKWLGVLDNTSSLLAVQKVTAEPMGFGRGPCPLCTICFLLNE